MVSFPRLQMLPSPKNDGQKDPTPEHATQTITRERKVGDNESQRCENRPERKSGLGCKILWSSVA